MALEISFGTTRFKPLPTMVNTTRLETSSLYGFRRSRSPAPGGFRGVLGALSGMGKRAPIGNRRAGYHAAARGGRFANGTKGSDRRLKHLFNFVKAGFVKARRNALTFWNHESTLRCGHGRIRTIDTGRCAMVESENAGHPTHAGRQARLRRTRAAHGQR